jgi:hypothetical protein
MVHRGRLEDSPRNSRGQVVVSDVLVTLLVTCTKIVPKPRQTPDPAVTGTIQRCGSPNGCALH